MDALRSHTRLLLIVLAAMAGMVSLGGTSAIASTASQMRRDGCCCVMHDALTCCCERKAAEPPAGEHSAGPALIAVASSEAQPATGTCLCRAGEPAVPHRESTPGSSSSEDRDHSGRTGPTASPVAVILPVVSTRLATRSQLESILPPAPLYLRNSRILI